LIERKAQKNWKKALKYRCVREKQALGNCLTAKKGKRIASWGQNFMKFSFVCVLTLSFNDILSKKNIKSNMGKSFLKK
jgi:hypothetical protein